MTTEKATKEFELMLEETAVSEACTIEDQELMGDACKNLRLAHGLNRNALCGPLKLDTKQIAEIEARCSAATARDYRAAVLLMSAQ